MPIYPIYKYQTLFSYYYFYLSRHLQPPFLSATSNPLWFEGSNDTNKKSNHQLQKYIDSTFIRSFHNSTLHLTIAKWATHLTKRLLPLENKNTKWATHLHHQLDRCIIAHLNFFWGQHVTTNTSRNERDGFEGFNVFGV